MLDILGAQRRSQKFPHLSEELNVKTIESHYHQNAKTNKKTVKLFGQEQCLLKFTCGHNHNKIVHDIYT